MTTVCPKYSSSNCDVNKEIWFNYPNNVQATLATCTCTIPENRKISSKVSGASEMVHVSYLIWDYFLFTLAWWATFAKYTCVNIEMEIKNLFHRTFLKAVFISKMNLKLERTFSVGLYWEWMGCLCVFNFSCYYQLSLTIYRLVTENPLLWNHASGRKF